MSFIKLLNSLVVSKDFSSNRIIKAEQKLAAVHFRSAVGQFHLRFSYKPL